MAETFNCLILGAAGRDFHDYLTFFRSRPSFRVKAFTATQIPFIESRLFPKSLAGPGYADIPIYSEQRLPELIGALSIDFVFLCYSDLSHEEVMHKASLVEACGASFVLLGPKHTQLESKKPVIAVTGVRTGVGKSPLTQWLARRVADTGRRVGIVRHPMPYGDLEAQAVQRFETFEDLDRFQCTIEEREEYEPYVEGRLIVYAGVDYARILDLAEQECDVLLWDGGNNDFPFFRPGLSITVCDALRPGHEVRFYPGELNARIADILVINKIDEAQPGAARLVRENLRAINPTAEIIESALEIHVDNESRIAGKRVLVVEDGPTITHGQMGFGAGLIAARRFAASEIVDPKPHAVGSIQEALEKNAHIREVLPALGYSAAQLSDLQETICRSGAEIVVDVSPASLDRLLEIDLPIVRIRYGFRQLSGPALETLVADFLQTPR